MNDISDITAEQIAMRRIYIDAWKKYQENVPMEPMEQLIGDVIVNHPEYHPYFIDNEDNLHKEFTETNPFLHIAMHIALFEQLQINRPQGIVKIYQELCKHDDEHNVQHRVLEVLSELMWEMMQNQTPYDDKIYLKRLKKLITTHP